MNELDHAVRDLLSKTPPGPGVDGIERRARRRRLRHGITVVIVGVLVAVATVGVIATGGHHSSSPQIALSPTTALRADATVAACALGGLQRYKAELEASEKQLNDQLLLELAAHSPNGGVTDAAHQSVLREMSDIDHQILATETAHRLPADLSPSVRRSLDPNCIKILSGAVVTWCEQRRFLDEQRVQLATLERQLNEQLTQELATHSPTAGATDASHQAVLREQSDVQQRIVKLEDERPVPSCSPDEPRSSSEGSTP